MSEILFQYHKVNPTTWVYLSSLLMLGLYFKFGRFWSARNLDLGLLILLAPGLLMAQYGGEASMKARRLAAIELQKRQTGLVTPQPAERNVGPDAETRLDGPDGRQTDQPAIAPPATVSPDAAAIPPLAEEPAGDPAEPAGGNEEPPATTAEAASPARARLEATSPAMDLIKESRKIERLGYFWLLSVGGLLLIRLLLDPTMVRRPLLEPNLTSGGLTFIGCSAFIFLMANVWNSRPLELAMLDEAALEATAVPGQAIERGGEAIRRGPGYALLNLVPSIPTNPLVPEGVGTARQEQSNLLIAKIIAVLCHLAVILGVVAIGYWHFGSMKTGIGVATLYLMLPYTAQMTGHIDHVVPAALLVWAVLCYRRPLTAGMFIGLATSLVYYPLFLLPLWTSFYWRKGLLRFSIGVVATLVVMAVSLYFIPQASYWENLKQMFGLWLPAREGLDGVWGLAWDPIYRIPVLAAFVAMCGTLAIWPAQKNLGTLLSCSAAVMVATQFWHGYGGGLYIGWYLPLLLLTIFRPNLEDRVALAVLGEGWLPRRVGVANGSKAA